MDWLAEHAREIRRRVRLEFVIELPLLKDRWKTILLGAVFQYVHAIFTQLAHRMHRPTKVPLHDLGFALLPELGRKQEWVSELIFGTMFGSFLLWTFSPFWFEKKRFYTAVLYARLLTVLVICQTLRIISFTVTQLPAPNYHCRLPEPTAVREWAVHWWDHLLVDIKRQSTHGCGDLIFSSHTTFALVGVMTYNEYGSHKFIKALAWLGGATLGVLIVASRKHYTVDVVVAWYVVPLVFYAMHRRWTTKRPISEEWPHRPLVDDQGRSRALEEVVVANSLAGKFEAKPLLPITAADRTGSGTVLHASSYTNGNSYVHSNVGYAGSNSGGSPPMVVPPPLDRDLERDWDNAGRPAHKMPITSSTIMRPRSTIAMAPLETGGRDGDSPGGSPRAGSAAPPSALGPSGSNRGTGRST